MDEHNQTYRTDWDDSVYGTGPTEPPKSRGGIIALMLILIIFLCGIITVLGILNIRLFQKLQLQRDNELAIAFTADHDPATVSYTEPAEILQTHPETETSSMDLHQIPEGDDVPSVSGSLPLQEIYSRNIVSVVSVTCTYAGGTGSGTGVILTENGYIVTNAHLVADAVSVTVQLSDGRVFAADIVGSDAVSDLSVICIRAGGLIPARFGDSASLQVGDSVTTIGDPLGVAFRGTFTNGIICAINRDVDMDGRPMTLLQTNAAVSSGGPLINSYGQVIGITTTHIGTFAGSENVEGIGFAIPSATVKEVVDQLITKGYVSGRPTLGIAGEPLSTFYQHYYRLPAGLYITEVNRGSDAQRKGVEDGDILISINGIPVTTMEEMYAVLYTCDVGDQVTAVFYRGGQQYKHNLVIAEEKD